MLKDIQTLGCASKVYVKGLALAYNVETNAAYSFRPGQTSIKPSWAYVTNA